MKEKGLHWWKSPYKFSEKLDFLKYRIFSPKATSNLVLAKDVQVIGREQNLLSPMGDEFSIIFAGDLMPFGTDKPYHSFELDQFFRSGDYVVFNLEGIATNRKRFLALAHTYGSLVEYLHGQFENKIVLNVANNHSSDFGYRAFEKQNEMLREEGFLVVGDNDSPLKIEEKRVNLFAGTFLSNQHPIIDVLTMSNPMRIGSIAFENTYNIFMPHWGYEMHLYPTQEQMDMGQSLVPDIYDSLIGHHPHTPHPIYLLKGNNILATSLGNYCYLNRNPNHWFGSLLKLSFTNNDGNSKPILSKVEVRYIKQHTVGDRIFIQEVEAHNFSESRASINFCDRGYLRDILK